MASKDLALAKGTVLQIPVDLGGVAISYNVPGAPKGLKLDASALAAIFEGVITNWDSPALASVTGVNNLPNLPIVPVHRADSSGPAGTWTTTSSRTRLAGCPRSGLRSRLKAGLCPRWAWAGSSTAAWPRLSHRGRAPSGSSSTATHFRPVSQTPPSGTKLATS